MQRFPKNASFAKLDSQETTAIVPKITYHGFCGKCATRAIGHAFLFAEQGNRVRVPDTEGICRMFAAPDESEIAGRQGRIPKVAVFLKYCFHAEKSVCDENRSLEGLSWLREKAEAMRLCEGKSSAHE